MRSLLFTEPVDFLIGNTYGKYLERDTGTPLIRIGFPIFDRHHHHRYPVWGYQGGMNVLVRILDKIFDEIDKNTNVAGEDRLQLRHHSLNAGGDCRSVRNRRSSARRSKRPDRSRRPGSIAARVLASTNRVVWSQSDLASAGGLR